MCKLKSGIILKDKIFISDYDSHTQMLEELHINDTTKNAENLFVRAELYPENGDIFSDVDTWKFKVDQDIVPEWFVEEYEEQRMKNEVKKWYEKHVFIGIDNLELSNGNFYLKDCKNTHLNNSTSKHYGNSTSEHYGNSTSEHYDNSTSEHYGNSTSKHFNNSTSEHYDNSTSKHYGNSTSKHFNNSTSVIPQYSSNNKDNIILCDNSTLKDCKTKTIYQSGDWNLILVKN